MPQRKRVEPKRMATKSYTKKIQGLEKKVPAQQAKADTSSRMAAGKKKVVSTRRAQRKAGLVSRQEVAKASSSHGRSVTERDAAKNKVQNTKAKIRSASKSLAEKKSIQAETRKKAIRRAGKVAEKAANAATKRLGLIGAGYTAADAAISAYYKSAAKKISNSSQVNSPKTEARRTVAKETVLAAQKARAKSISKKGVGGTENMKNIRKIKAKTPSQAHKKAQAGLAAKKKARAKK